MKKMKKDKETEPRGTGLSPHLFKRLRQEDHKLKVCLGNRESSRLA